MKFNLFVRNGVKHDKKSSEPTVNEISAVITHRLQVIWNLPSILIVSGERIPQIALNRSFCSKQQILRNGSAAIENRIRNIKLKINIFLGEY